jgi:TetR/AcrR family transcriptional repressor of mexJK operon
MEPVGKREQILAAARECFIRKGFHGATIDEIVATAGVSKPTIYKVVGNKEELFAAIVKGTAEDILGELDNVEYSTGPDVESNLFDFSLKYATILLCPSTLEFHRLAVSEAGRFPELGRRYFAAGPGAVEKGLAEYLGHLAADGHLQIDDLNQAAQHFWAVAFAPRRQALLFGVAEPDAPALEESVRQGLRFFMRAYRVD